MRRSTAISQTLLLLAFYLVPLLATSSVVLPACCRREGAHHCGMKERDTGDQPVLSDTVHCPYSCPGMVLTHPAKLFLDPSQFVFVIPASHEVLLPENNRRVQAQLAAGRDSRGPPSLTL